LHGEDRDTSVIELIVDATKPQRLNAKLLKWVLDRPDLLQIAQQVTIRRSKGRRGAVRLHIDQD
jgi:hypothetical protein